MHFKNVGMPAISAVGPGSRPRARNAVQVSHMGVRDPMT